MKRTRKGFTLIELLIVIAIIGILASMATLSSSSATAQAKATSILAGFKTVRGAVNMYVLASGDEATVAWFNSNASKEYVEPETVKLMYRFAVTSKDDSHWYATYKFGLNEQAIVDKFMPYSKDARMTGKAGTKTIQAEATMKVF